MRAACSPRNGARRWPVGQEVKFGIGDQIIGTGIARGACLRGKRIAFGDGTRIRWDQHSARIFSRNPDIAAPGSELAKDLEWIPFYKGNRIYNRQGDNCWIWNYDFHVRPGAIYLTQREQAEARPYGLRHVVIEPHVALWKSGVVNKDWGRARYQAVADALIKRGRRVLQCDYGGGPMLDNVVRVPTRAFRNALALLAYAGLYIGPEGGMHHGAAAVGIPAVVIFGGFVPPSVTGYNSHVNLTGGETTFCGSFDACPHCRAALDRISVDEVLDATAIGLPAP